MAWVLTVLHLVALVGMLVFAVHRLKILALYLRRRPEPPFPAPYRSDQEGLPTVCVQLPLYNEPGVVEGLLEHVARLDWPKDRLEIQILDDSTDGTAALIEDWLARHPRAAARCRHLRRTRRTGFKAGALAEGMAQSTARFFAIFDADFRPPPDFLLRLMPTFEATDVGVIQARWDYTNRRASLLTWVQSILLDAHFVIEQRARHRSGLYFNFNGTAGIWRRQALEDAGGWTSDTVTEDLDASYRSQMMGWRFVYRHDVPVPSELPQNLTAFKSQQRRWTKGGMQVARKLLATILRSGIPGPAKREACFHLTIGSVHLFLLLFAVTLVPFLLVHGGRPDGLWPALQILLFVLAGGSTVAYYAGAQFFRPGPRPAQRALEVVLAAPLLMAFGIALSLTFALAALEGLWRHGGEFVRTPKGGTRRTERALVRPRRARTLFVGLTLAEWTIGTVLAVGAVHFASVGLFGLTLTLGLKAGGFLCIAVLSTQDLLDSLGLGWDRFFPARPLPAPSSGD